MKFCAILLTLFLTMLPPSVKSTESDAKVKAKTGQHKLQREYCIEISISKCRLTLYEKSEQNFLVPVRKYTVGTAVRGLGVYPLGKGRVTRIELNPYWHPTNYTREIFEHKGKELPKAVPPGHPLNYMGMFKIHLSHTTSRGNIYRIHGNNNKSRVGKRVTGGCICMDNDEGVELAKTIPVGTMVNIVL